MKDTNRAGESSEQCIICKLFSLFPDCTGIVLGIGSVIGFVLCQTLVLGIYLFSNWAHLISVDQW